MCISLPTTTSRPLLDLNLSPTAYRPDLRHLVPVPTCFPSRRKAYSRLFPSRRPPSCSHAIPTFALNFSHPATPIRKWQICPFYLPRVARFPHNMTMNATGLLQLGLFNIYCWHYVEKVVRLILMYLLIFGPPPSCDVFHKLQL